jgi:hypothetical protein
MDAFETVAVLAVIAALWIAALLFGRDSCDGADWLGRTNPSDRPPRIGD